MYSGHVCFNRIVWLHSYVKVFKGFVRMNKKNADGSIGVLGAESEITQTPCGQAARGWCGHHQADKEYARSEKRPGNRSLLHLSTQRRNILQETA